MLRLRLQRRGKRNYATYRVVVADQHAPIKGKFVADVGHYNPHTDEFSVDKDAVTAWLEKGAQPTATVHNLLVANNFLKAEKVTSWRPKKKEEVAAESEEASGGEEKPAEATADTGSTDEEKKEPAEESSGEEKAE